MTVKTLGLDLAKDVFQVHFVSANWLRELSDLTSLNCRK